MCDAVVRALDLRPGQDGLQALLLYLEQRPVEDQAECIRSFWQEVRYVNLDRSIPDDESQISKPPPPPISAFPPHSTRPEAAPQPSLSSPNYHPPPTVSQGQAVFWRYSIQIFSALLHFSLAGGFSAVRVVNVLRETNYLTGTARDATYRRLLETTQAVMDYMVGTRYD